MDLAVGIIIGFFVSLIVLRRSINKTGYGELRLCRESCPYYQNAPISVDTDEDGEDDDK